MAKQDAPRDNNNTPAMLGSNAAGTETRRVVVDDNGSFQTTESPSSGQDSVYRSIDVDESEEAATSAASVLRGYYISNRASSERTLKIYDGTVASVTVGTTTPKMSIPLAAGQSANLSNMKIPFATGIVIAATTGIADNDTGAPAANEVVANIYYQAV